MLANFVPRLSLAVHFETLGYKQCHFLFLLYWLVSSSFDIHPHVFAWNMLQHCSIVPCKKEKYLGHWRQTESRKHTDTVEGNFQNWACKTTTVKPLLHQKKCLAVIADSRALLWNLQHSPLQMISHSHRKHMQHMSTNEYEMMGLFYLMDGSKSVDWV